MIFPKQCTDPMKERSCLMFFGAARFDMVDVFNGDGEIPY